MPDINSAGGLVVQREDRVERLRQMREQQQIGELENTVLRYKIQKTEMEDNIERLAESIEANEKRVAELKAAQNAVKEKQSNG